VRVEGEVAVPGVYQFRRGETLRQLVERAGGLTSASYLFGAEFNRESVRKEQQARLDEVATRAEQDLERTAAIQAARAVTPEEVASLKAQGEAQRRTVSKLRAIRATGRMVLELRADASSVNDLPDVVLEDGDRFFVPMRYSTVSVYGSVYNSSNYLYKPGKRISEYLHQAGGPTRFADTGSIYVLRADGSVTSRSQSGWFSNYGGTELMPNDAIVVPEEFSPTSWIKELKDWSQILYQFGLGAAAIKVLTQ
jgi:protein involved in polysaccharide export with SLBB domain